MKKIKGVPQGFFETGTEGVLYAVQDENFINEKGHYSYEGLHILKPGDHVKVIDKSNGQVWVDSEVEILIHRQENYETILGGCRVPWIPAHVDLWAWTEIFVLDYKQKGLEFEVILNKKENK